MSCNASSGYGESVLLGYAHVRMPESTVCKTVKFEILWDSCKITVKNKIITIFKIQTDCVKTLTYIQLRIIGMSEKL